MNKTASIIITAGLLIGLAILFAGESKDSPGGGASTQSAQNVEIRDGVQYITILAKGGYSPRTSEAKADVPTKLIVKTNSTFDCSAALVIRSLGYQKILVQTGEEVIDLGTPKQGDTIEGVCSMGMYSFRVNFK